MGERLPPLIDDRRCRGLTGSLALLVVLTANGMMVQACSRPEPTVAGTAGPVVAAPDCNDTTKVVTDTINGQTVQAVLTLTPVGTCAGAPKGELWGSGGDDHYISRLTLSVGGDDLVVPPSAYLDFANPASVTVQSSGKAMVLRMVSKGEERSIAEMRFDGKRVLSRKVWIVGFEESATETAIYTFTVE